MALTSPVSSDEALRLGGWRPGPRMTDVLAAVAYTGPALAAAVAVPTADGPALVLPLMAAVVSGTALLFRRQAPMSSFGRHGRHHAHHVLGSGQLRSGGDSHGALRRGHYRSARHAVLALLAISAILLAAAVQQPRSMVDLGQAVQAIAVLVIATLLGLNVRMRRNYVAALVDHADRLMHEREYLASIAAAAERNAIARRCTTSSLMDWR